MMAASLVVKVIGAFFQIPLQNLIGGEKSPAFGMFSAAYRIYTAMLVVSTVGLPAALSKMVAEATARGREHEVRRIVRVAAGIFVPVGALCSLALFFGAGTFAAWIKSEDSRLAVMAIAPSVLMVAILSVFRGYYQGRSNMVPTAVSQVIEAAGKLFIGLGLACWAVGRGFDDPVVAALTVLGIWSSRAVLVMMGTPEDVIGNSVAYFRTYFLGSIAVVMYNVGASILQSVGNSRSPMKYLITASLINIVLDLLFIGVLGYGVAAAAFATIISQSVSAILAFSKLMRSKEAWAVSWRKVRFDGPMLHGVILQGLPSGIQNSVISLANVIVQANINSFGALAMAGCGSYSKVEGFAFLPVTCFSMALATFVSQNVGAGKPDRVHKGMRFGVICSITLAECVGVAVYLLAPWLIGAFSSEADVVAFGVRQAHTIALFYFLLAFSHCCAGILRGLGRPIVPMAVMLAVWCALRITYITVTLHFIHDIGVIFWAYPLTWSISSLMFLHYLRHCMIPRVGGGAPHDMKDA